MVLKREVLSQTIPNHLRTSNIWIMKTLSEWWKMKIFQLYKHCVILIVFDNHFFFYSNPKWELEYSERHVSKIIIMYILVAPSLGVRCYNIIIFLIFQYSIIPYSYIIRLICFALVYLYIPWTKGGTYWY
jgi:hypothetical protein